MKHLIRFAFAGLFFMCAFAAFLPAYKLDAKRFEKITQVEREMIKIAEEYYNRKKWKQAENEFTKYIKIYQNSPASPYVQFQIAYCVMRQKKISSAISEFTAVIDYFPKSREASLAQLYIGHCHLKNADSPKAIKAYTKVIDTYPKSHNAFQALWILADKIYEKLDANAEIRKKRDECYKTLVNEYKKYKRDRIWRYAFDRLFNIYLWGRKLQDARKIGKFRWKPVDVEFKIAHKLKDIAVHYYRKKQVAESEKFAEAATETLKGFSDRFPAQKDKAIEVIWATGDMYKSFARVYRQKDRQEKYLLKTVKQYEEYVEKKPKSKRAKQINFIIGDLYGGMGRMPRAIEYFTRYMDRHKNDASKGRIAGYYQGKKMYKEAIAIYEGFKNQNQATWNIAGCYEKLNDAKNALEHYKKVVTMWPEKSQDAKYNMGGIYQHMTRDYKKAIAAYQQSARVPDSIFRVGECYSSMGKYETAITTYQEILFLRKKGHSAHALWRIAHEYQKWGKKEKMIDTLRGLINRYKKSGWASKAHQKLERMGIKPTGGQSKE